MKTLLVALSLLVTSQLAYAVSNCYIYSDTPKLEERCERDYLAQQQEYRNQTDQFDRMVNQTNHEHATAQEADTAVQQQNQMDQLLKLLNPEKSAQ